MPRCKSRHFSLRRKDHCSLRNREPGQGIAIEGARLPRVLVPLTVGGADDFDRQDHGQSAEAVLLSEAVIDQSPIYPNREPGRPRQLAIAQDLHLIFTRALVHEEDIRGVIGCARVSVPTTNCAPTKSPTLPPRVSLVGVGKDCRVITGTAALVFGTGDLLAVVKEV